MATEDDASEPSELYTACLNGDVTFVRDYLAKNPDVEIDLNTLEPTVHSTPLHAASQNGHKDIVRLLIEHGCDRSYTDKNGLTAYEVAVDDETRQVFKRPTGPGGTERFFEEDINECFSLLRDPDDQSEEAAGPVFQIPGKKKKTPSVATYMTEPDKELEIGHAITSITLCQSKVGRVMADIFQREAPMTTETIADRLRDIIKKEIVSIKDPQSQKATKLLTRFLSDDKEKCVQHLIRLYTLETSFYSALKQNPIPLAVPVFKMAETLQDRYFQGTSYRGTQMTDDELAIYESVAKHSGSLLQIKHFTSTSTKRWVAEKFAVPRTEDSKKSKRNPVLLTFTFPEPCEQAISLNRLSKTQPCLSEFEDEDEVLVLPWTLFQVERVCEESSSSYEIYLSNISLPEKSLASSIKWVLKHPVGCIKRFYEHFPDRQPETVVQHIADTLPPVDRDVLKENPEQ